jgi:hypothetical protein
MSVDDRAVDEAIFEMLAILPGHWRKVAAVVAIVNSALGHALPEGDAGYQIVARRIEALVGQGRLLAQGDIGNWRFSEVRLSHQPSSPQNPS